ncbi:uncharacterized protein PRD47_018574 [Ara ararauna]
MAGAGTGAARGRPGIVLLGAVGECRSVAPVRDNGPGAGQRPRYGTMAPVPESGPGTGEWPRCGTMAPVRDSGPGAGQWPRYRRVAPVRDNGPGAGQWPRYGTAAPVRDSGPGAGQRPRCRTMALVRDSGPGTGQWPRYRCTGGKVLGADGSGYRGVRGTGGSQYGGFWVSRHRRIQVIAVPGARGIRVSVYRGVRGTGGTGVPRSLLGPIKEGVDPTALPEAGNPARANIPAGAGALPGAAVSLVGAQVTYESVEVPENKRATIPCSAYEFGLKNPRIEWKFQKGSSLVFLYYQGELMEPYKDRIQFSPSNIVFLTVTRADTGRYICEVVEDGSKIAKSEVNLIVQVPPSKPVAHVPTSATISSKVVLRCTETDGSPPPTFRWYKDGMLLPTDPKSSPSFRNSSYSLDTATGELVFQPLSSSDSGDYSCEASNNVGSPQRSDAIHMEASEVNVGGIVAAVVVLLMVLALAAFGIWFAYSRGFFSSESWPPHPPCPPRCPPPLCPPLTPALSSAWEGPWGSTGDWGGGAGGVCSVSHLPIPFSSCSTTSKKVIYSQPSHRSQGEFKQTSSFLV